MAKYKNSRYPEKINDLVDNNGKLNIKEVDGHFVIDEPQPEPEVKWQILSLSWEDINNLSNSNFYAFDFENNEITLENYESGDPYNKIICANQNQGGILVADDTTNIVYMLADPNTGEGYEWLDGQSLPLECAAQVKGSFQMKTLYANTLNIRGVQFIISTDKFIVKYTNDPNYIPVEPEPAPTSDYGINFEINARGQLFANMVAPVHKFIREITFATERETEWDIEIWSVTAVFEKDQYNHNSYNIVFSKGWGNSIDFYCQTGFTKANDDENIIVGSLDDYQEDFSQDDIDFLFDPDTQWEVGYAIFDNYLGDILFGDGK